MAPRGMYGMPKQPPRRTPSLFHALEDGKYMNAPYGFGDSTISFGAGNGSAWPIVMDKRVRVDRVGVVASTANATATVSIGIYNSGADSGYAVGQSAGNGEFPAEALFIASGIDTSTSGYKEVACDLVLPRLFFAAWATATATTALRAVGSSSVPSHGWRYPFLASEIPTGAGPNLMWLLSGSALPTHWSTSRSFANGSSPPRFFFRVVEWGEW